jgi:hypothetical protein
MTAVVIELGLPRPADTDTIELVPDLDVLSESNRCNCAASDDNPY